MGKHPDTMQLRQTRAKNADLANIFGSFNFTSGRLQSRYSNTGTGEFTTADVNEARRVTREAQWTNGFFQYSLKKLLRYVIGSRVSYKPYTLDDNVAEALDRFWRLPSLSQRYDADNFGDLLSLAYRDYLIDGEIGFAFLGKEGGKATRRVQEIGIAHCDAIQGIGFDVDTRKRFYMVGGSFETSEKLDGDELTYFSNVLTARSFRGFPPMYAAARASVEYTSLINFALQAIEIRAALHMVMTHLHKIKDDCTTEEYERMCAEVEQHSVPPSFGVINLHGDIETGNAGTVDFIKHDIGASDIDQVADIVRRYAANTFGLNDLLLGYPEGSNRASSANIIRDSVRGLLAERATPSNMFAKTFSRFLQASETRLQANKPNYVIGVDSDGENIMGSAAEVEVQLLYSSIDFSEISDVIAVIDKANELGYTDISEDAEVNEANRKLLIQTLLKLVSIEGNLS